MKETGLFARVRTLFHELLGEQETRVDRLTLTLIEDAPSGPYWDLRVEGDKNFSLSSDELVINLGAKRPAIKFTNAGMSTICLKCGGDVSYGGQGKVIWWCEECEINSHTPRARNQL